MLLLRFDLKLSLILYKTFYSNLFFMVADSASPAVQNEAPKRTKSLTKNWPGIAEINGNECPFWITPGVDNINVRVMTKVIMPPILPKADAIGLIERRAINSPVEISITPSMLENPWVLKKLNFHEKNGLCSAKGRIPSAS